MNDLQASVWDNPRFQSRRAVDLLSREFEQQWHEEKKPSIDSFVEKSDVTIRSALLPELVAAEWELRTLSGERPQVSEYLERYPQLRSLLAELQATDFLSRDKSEPAATGALPKAGEEFCGYHLVKELGRGAMGTVFLAELPVIGHKVALKILGKHLYTQTGGARFEREARLLSRMDHPAIVPLYSYGESGGIRYLVMKAINGPSLATLLAPCENADSSAEGELPSAFHTIKNKHSPGRKALLFNIARQAIESLKAVHEADILHRDIKPSNILITESSQIYLTDFSLARIESTEADLTRTDEFVGTLRYCAPESLDAVYTRQSDLYSLGLVLFELFSLTAPFSARTRRELLNQKLSGRVPEMSSKFAHLSAPVEHLLQKMTAYRPGDRYQSADEVLEALEKCEQQTNSQRSSKRKLATAVVCLTILLAFAAVTAEFRSRIELQPTAGTLIIASNAEGKLRSEQVRPAITPADTRKSETQWLIPEHRIALPQGETASLMSLSADGSRLMTVVNSATLLMGPASSGELSVTKTTGLSPIRHISQSRSGSTSLIVCIDPGRPDPRLPGSAVRQPDYFVETHVRSRDEWFRIGGQHFHMNHDMPEFSGSLASPEFNSVLIPDTEAPVVWCPTTHGFGFAKWPEGERTAVAASITQFATAMKDGTLLLRDLTGNSNLAPDMIVQTNQSNCYSLRFTPTGKYLIALDKSVACVILSLDANLVGSVDISSFQSPVISFSNRDELIAVTDSRQVRVVDVATATWKTSLLTFENDVLLASPLPESQDVLVAEKSGRISLLKLTDSMNVSREQQTTKLVIAQFSETARRLALATADGHILCFHVP